MARTYDDISSEEQIMIWELNWIANERYAYKNASWIWEWAEITWLSGYTVTNKTETKILDCDSTSINELADVLWTLIEDIDIIWATNWLTWGDIATGTTWNGVTLNVYSSATQATGQTYLIYAGLNYNTNSDYNNYWIRLFNENNAWIWDNTWIYLNNRSVTSNLTDGNVPVWAWLWILQVGVWWNAIVIKTAQDILTTNWLVNIKLNDTQSWASTIMKLDAWTSAQANIILDVDWSTSAKVMNIWTNLTQAWWTATWTTVKEIKIQINGVDYIIEAKSVA